MAALSANQLLVQSATAAAKHKREPSESVPPDVKQRILDEIKDTNEGHVDQEIHHKLCKKYNLKVKIQSMRNWVGLEKHDMLASSQRRGAPPLLLDLEKAQVQESLKDIRVNGERVTAGTACNLAKTAIMIRDAMLLKDFGGTIVVSVEWGRQFLLAMKWKEFAKTTSRLVSAADICEEGSHDPPNRNGGTNGRGVPR
jgi:hypothetical protein